MHPRAEPLIFLIFVHRDIFVPALTRSGSLILGDLFVDIIFLSTRPPLSLSNLRLHCTMLQGLSLEFKRAALICVFLGRQHGVLFVCESSFFVCQTEERGKKTTHISSQRNNPLQSQQGRRSAGRESAQLLNVTHFSGEFSNTVKPKQNRNILLFHEQHSQTTVLPNQHCV